MPIYVRSGGAWHQVRDRPPGQTPYLYSRGWKDLENGYVRTGGQWKQVYAQYHLPPLPNPATFQAQASRSWRDAGYVGEPGGWRYGYYATETGPDWKGEFVRQGEYPTEDGFGQHRGCYFYDPNDFAMLGDRRITRATITLTRRRGGFNYYDGETAWLMTHNARHTFDPNFRPNTNDPAYVDTWPTGGKPGSWVPITWTSGAWHENGGVPSIIDGPFNLGPFRWNEPSGVRREVDIPVSYFNKVADGILNTDPAQPRGFGTYNFHYELGYPITYINFECVRYDATAGQLRVWWEYP